MSDHLLSYGHGAIYAQKAFELLDMIGWERAHTVLPHLVPTIVYGTREDKLPYMRPFMRSLGVDSTWRRWPTRPSIRHGPTTGRCATCCWPTIGTPRCRRAVDGAARRVPASTGCSTWWSTPWASGCCATTSAGEFDFADDFGWLDITHGLTYANAVRWHHRAAVERGNGTTPDLVRLALFTAFLAQWTGRHEWHTVGRRTRARSTPLAADLTAYGEALQRQSLLDGTTAFIVHAHAVKTSRAAALEAQRLGSSQPLDAVARFLAAPKLERFVAATVERSIDFLNGRTQRD